MTPKTGWPPGMLQDDDRRLSRWLASRPGARHQVRKNIMEMTDKQTEALRLADELLAMFGPTEIDERIAAELRRLHAENEKFKDANITLMERIDRRDARIAALEQAGRMALVTLERYNDHGRGFVENNIARLRQTLGDDA